MNITVSRFACHLKHEQLSFAGKLTRSRFEHESSALSPEGVWLRNASFDSASTSGEDCSVCSIDR